MTWSARRFRAVVAVCLLLAASLAAAWGRKPPKEEEVKVTLRPLSPSEVMDILHNFPEMVPSYLASARNDTYELARLFRFSEVTTAPLKRAFPAARFYRGFDFGKLTDPHRDFPFIIAIRGDERCRLPIEINRLLFSNDLKVTHKNILTLAKAFIVATIGAEYDSYPQIAFLDAKRVDTVFGETTWDARLKVKLGEQVEVWYFDSRDEQFRLVSRRTETGQTLKEYAPLRAEPPPKR